MISIVIANYNKALFIAETIQSVMRQSYLNWEIVFVDDGSTDDSIDVVLNAVDGDARVRIEANATGRKGANIARNIGWRAAKFNYILFLDSDDVLAPHCLKTRLSYILRNNLDFNVFPGGTFLQSVGDRKIIWKPQNSKYPLESFLRHDLPWHLTSVLWSKVALQEIGGFSEDLPRLQDVDIHARALLSNLRFLVVENKAPDFFYRVAPERKTFAAYELGKRYVEACDIFQKSMYNLINESEYSDSKKTMYFRRLRGTTLSMMYRFAIESSSGLLTEAQKRELQEALQSSHSSHLIFKGASRELLFAYRKLVNAGCWKAKGFTKVTKFLLA